MKRYSYKKNVIENLIFKYFHQNYDSTNTNLSSYFVRYVPTFENWAYIPCSYTPFASQLTETNF